MRVTQPFPASLDARKGSHRLGWQAIGLSSETTAFLPRQRVASGLTDMTASSPSASVSLMTPLDAQANRQLMVCKHLHRTLRLLLSTAAAADAATRQDCLFL